MTTKADGTTTCDGCGADLEDGGLASCAVVSVLAAEESGHRVVNLHYGLASLCGCAGSKLLSKAARAEAPAFTLAAGRPRADELQRQEQAREQQAATEQAAAKRAASKRPARKRAPAKRAAAGGAKP